MEGRVRTSPQRPVLRVPPQHGDLLQLRVGLQTAACVLQVGCDGGDRVAPRPAGGLPAPIGHRSGRLPRHRAQPGSATAVADRGREHDPGDEQRHLRRHLLGAPRLRHRGRRNPRLRTLLGTEHHSSPLLAGFEAIEAGRRALDDATGSPTTRRTAVDLIWAGNLQLLEHEQRALVQPNFDRLSCTFARLVSIGSATSIEVRGVRRGVAYFTSFYLYSLTRGIPHAVRAQAWPRITRLDDRWRWLEASVVPRFRRFDADTRLVAASLQRIVDEARVLASAPCIHLDHEQSSRRTPRDGVPRQRCEPLPSGDPP
jgi:hypothetical protein